MKLDKIQLRTTGEKKRFIIGGRPEELEIFEVPLSELRFNQKNGRIASYISEYIDEVGNFPEEQEEINGIIEEFIVKSNDTAFKRTKNNIKQFMQLEPAVVLDSGVVVDGNRRFSALRQLQREHGDKYGYLKAAIIPSKYDSRQIKILELNLQHAKDNPVDYNPIERLVDIYRDIIKNEGTPEGFTIEEYARETDTTPNNVKKEVEIAELMIEYLQFIKQPEKFHIARKHKIDGPLREINKIIKSKKVNEDDIEEIKDVLFGILSTAAGDVTREIRKLKKTFENPVLAERFLEETEDVLDDLEEYFDDEDIQDEIGASSNLNVPIVISEEIENITDQIIDESNLDDARRRPIELIKKSVNSAESIELKEVSMIEGDLNEEFTTYFNKLKSLVNDIEEVLGNAE